LDIFYVGLLDLGSNYILVALLFCPTVLLVPILLVLEVWYNGYFVEMMVLIGSAKHHKGRHKREVTNAKKQIKRKK